MDFLDPKKKRAHRTRLYAGYGLMAIVLAIATFILGFAAYGYDIDRNTGNIIQNGLLIVDAHPESADIVINNVSHGNTSSRLVLPAAMYSLQLNRPGYRSWKHQINLEGSTIEQLAYPFLFPEKLVSKAIQQYAAVPTLASESPDRHWLVVQPSVTSSNTFNVVDLSTNKHPIVTMTLPAGIITEAEGSHGYEAVEWSTDNTHLLLKHSYTGGTEFIMLDRATPSGSLNITKAFPDQQYTSLSLRDKKAEQLYMFNDNGGALQIADTQTKVVNPLLSGVVSYKSYQADTLVYVTNPANDPKNAEVHLFQNSADHFLKTIPVAPRYLLDAAQFNGHMYVAAGSPADGKVYAYQDPFNDYSRRPARTPQPFRVLIVPAGEYVSFSGNARFISVQGGSKFAVYDIENDRQFRYDLKLSLLPQQKATWMDGHRMSIISQGMVNIYDFDGQNIQTLSPSLSVFNAYFDRDYTALFTLVPTTNAPDKPTLTRTELKVLSTGTNQ